MAEVKDLWPIEPHEMKWWQAGYRAAKKDAVASHAPATAPSDNNAVSMSKALDYLGRSAASTKDSSILALAQELARFALQSFSLQVSESPEAVRLREVCYAIMRTKLAHAPATAGSDEDLQTKCRFVVRHQAWKDDADDAEFNECSIAEVVDNKPEVELVITQGKLNHYIRFRLADFERALKEFGR